MDGIKKIIPPLIKKIIKQQIFLISKFFIVIKLVIRNPKNYFNLTKEEKRLFAEPWYNDFSDLGIKTQQQDKKDKLNQNCKQKIIFGLIGQALDIAGKDSFGLDLFCANGFYANYSVRQGAVRIDALDLNEYEISKAKLITKLLGNSEKINFLVKDVFESAGPYDFAICTGGLYHISNPDRLLVDLRQKVKKALIIQTVYSLANEDKNYFETPAPGWTWGCRFSHKFLLNMVESAGWNIIHSEVNVLRGNHKPQSQGSAYLLCVPK
jgi:hypothetical protein